MPVLFFFHFPIDVFFLPNNIKNKNK